MRSVYVLLLPAMLLLFFSGCASVKERTPPNVEQADGIHDDAVDILNKKAIYVHVAIIFPQDLSRYMRYLHQSIPKNPHYRLSPIRRHSPTLLSFFAQLHGAHTHDVYSFIRYSDAHNPPTIDVSFSAADLAALLQIPPEIIPPSSVQLSEAEIVEFYRWQLAQFIPADQIETLFRTIKIELSLVRGNILEKQKFDVISRAHVSLLQFLSTNYVLTVRM